LSNKQSKPYLILTVAICAALLGATLHYLQTAKSDQSVAPAVEFSLLDMQNQPRSSKEWRGKLVLINFWASWCPPCIREMPALNELRLKNLASNFEIIGITAEPAQDALRYLDNNPVSFPILDGEKELATLGEHYGNSIGSIPFSVLLDRNGQIIKRYFGEVNLAALQIDIDTHK